MIKLGALLNTLIFSSCEITIIDGFHGTEIVYKGKLDELEFRTLKRFDQWIMARQSPYKHGIVIHVQNLLGIDRYDNKQF